MSIERPTCKTCPYWLADDDSGIGECHRQPPLAAGMVYGTGALLMQVPYSGTWVDIEDFEWCGEHPDFPDYLAALKAEKHENSDA